MTRDTKMIVASNLVNAALLRSQSLKGTPVTPNEKVIMEMFAEFVGLLEEKYPEK